MREKNIQDDLLRTPINQYKGEVAPDFANEEELLKVTGAIELFINNVTDPSELEQSNVFYWLTHGLLQAMRHKHLSSAFTITSLFYKLSDSCPNVVISMLKKKIEAGEYKGQTGAVAWTDRFHSSTFDSRYNLTLISMEQIFLKLLRHGNHELCLVLTKPSESGSYKGTNALLNLVYALKNAAGYENNQPTTILIANLLTDFIHSFPAELGFALTQEVEVGSLFGTTAINLIAATIGNAAKDNIEAIKIITDLLITINEKHSLPLMKSLTKITQTGPNKGLNPLHILLTTMVSTSYIPENVAAVNLLAALINQLFIKSPDTICSALTQPIATGGRQSENGIMYLVHASANMMQKNIDSSAINQLLLNLLEHGGDGLTKAFDSVAPSKSRHYLRSPLAKLENILNETGIKAYIKDDLVKIVSTLKGNDTASSPTIS